MSSITIKKSFLKIPITLILFLASCVYRHDAAGVDMSGEAGSSVVKVCEGIYRGSRPDDLHRLKSFNVRTILDLENNAEAVNHEEAAAKDLGIEMIKLPMSEISRPRPADLMKAVEIMQDPRFQPVYVHCLHGRDRTGLAVAAYKILHDGWTVDRAYREAIDYGHTWWFYDLIFRWKKSLREVSAQKSLTTAPAQGRLPAEAPAAS